MVTLYFNPIDLLIFLAYQFLPTIESNLDTSKERGYQIHPIKRNWNLFRLFIPIISSVHPISYE
jgi:hypothetical protein